VRRPARVLSPALRLDSSAVRRLPFGGSWNIRHAIDRFLADKRIGAGIEVETDEFARLLALGCHGQKSGAKKSGGCLCRLYWH
jgi:hypothetical protein